MTDTFTPRTPSNAPATEPAKRKRGKERKRERERKRIARILNRPYSTCSLRGSSKLCKLVHTVCNFNRNYCIQKRGLIK